jgi:UDP-glucose 4-epimerase
MIGDGHTVAVVDDLSTGKIKNLNPKAEFLKADIGSKECAEFISAFRPEAIDHHAAQIDVRRSVADPAYDAGINVVGMVRVIKAAADAGVGRFIFSSSGGAIYGEQDTFPAPEDHPVRPASPYGLTKKIGEMYLEWFSTAFRLPYVALRYANVYGPRQDPLGEAGVVAIFTGRMTEGGEVTINGDGRQTRDFVFVGDIVSANMAALKTAYAGPVNIGTGVETSVNEVFRTLADATGYTLKPSYGPAKKGEQLRSVIDPSLARRVLGWAPKVTFPDGIAKTVAWHRAG